MSDDTDTPDEFDSYSASISSIDTVITFLAILHILTGILAIPQAYSIFTSDIFQAPIIVTVVVIILGSLLSLAIPILFILGWAIWSLQSRAWKFAVIFNIILLVITISGQIVLIAIMNIILLLILNSADVRLTLKPPKS